MIMRIIATIILIVSFSASLRAESPFEELHPDLLHKRGVHPAKPSNTEKVCAPQPTIFSESNGYSALYAYLESRMFLGSSDVFFHSKQMWHKTRYHD